MGDPLRASTPHHEWKVGRLAVSLVLVGVRSCVLRVGGMVGCWGSRVLGVCVLVGVRVSSASLYGGGLTVVVRWVWSVSLASAIA